VRPFHPATRCVPVLIANRAQTWEQVSPVERWLGFVLSLVLAVRSCQRLTVSVVLHETCTHGLKEVVSVSLSDRYPPSGEKTVPVCSDDCHFQSSASLHTTSIPDWPKCPPTFLYIRRIRSSREPEAASFSETAEQQTPGAITISIRQPINIDILPFGWQRVAAKTPGCVDGGC
jgi:hypothetical protein